MVASTSTRTSESDHGGIVHDTKQPGRLAAAFLTADLVIGAAFEADDPDAAHDDLHVIGHVLEDLPKLAGTAGFALDRKAVERSAGVLFDVFSRIDDKLHGGTGSTYAEEAKTISKELGAFRAFLAEHRP